MALPSMITIDEQLMGKNKPGDCKIKLSRFPNKNV